MNLIRPEIWNYELPWGVCLDSHICTAMPYNVEWSDKITMHVRREVQRGWWRNKKWELNECLTDYSSAMIVSKEGFGYGTFKMVATVPGYKGSWPAFWLIDVSGEMGIPPEVDIMEHIVKDSCLAKYRLTCSYHDLPDTSEQYSRETCKTVRQTDPWDKREHIFSLVWTPDKMAYAVDGKEVMVITPDQCRRFPDKPMNVLVEHKICRPDTGIIKPFIISELSYY